MIATQIPPSIAEVAVAAPIDKTLSYRIPGPLREDLRIGSRVRVPLGRRLAVGYVMGWSAEEVDGLKEIRELLDTTPLFHPQHAQFYRRAAEYYAYPLGEVVRTALPAGLSGRGQEPVILQDRLYRPTACRHEPRGARQQEVLAAVRAAGELPLSRIREEFKSPYATLHRLVELGLLSEVATERRRDPFLGLEIAAHQAVTLTPAQVLVMQQISAAVTALPKFAPYLLHGVTGSGKTEVYLRAIAEVLETGRQALVLVPEIALTPQLVARFRSWFQDRTTRLGVLHSALSVGERYDVWRTVAKGDVDVVIGARSAVFAPLPDLGLIVVDEEHDGSYKQTEAFRYNARDLALLRGQMEQALVILGSATPALTTYRRAQDGKLGYLELTERAAGRPLPTVELVDMTKAGIQGSLSQTLHEALRTTLEAGEQALLLLNRRGYAPFLLCHDCGATLRCPNCEITLTYSQAQRSLRCHYCDYRQRPPELCGRCNGQALLPEGVGTERLEEEVQTLFPDARVARMDRDTTTRKGAHAQLVDRMNAGKIDILIGTQMIAKGHDFPVVTLVGVLNTDTALNLPDFRSTERVYALLSQVAGRAGRGERPGRVLIQTYNADHEALDYVTRHAYAEFAKAELAHRQDLAYPPYGYLVNLILAGNDSAKVQACAESIAAALCRHTESVDILGPAPCLLARLRNKHRWQILLKARDRSPLRRLVAGLDRLANVPAGVTMTVDVDPVDMF